MAKFSTPSNFGISAFLSNVMSLGSLDAINLLLCNKKTVAKLYSMNDILQQFGGRPEHDFSWNSQAFPAQVYFPAPKRPPWPTN